MHLPEADLACLPEGTELFGDYIKAVAWAQAFARANREVMMERIFDVLAQEFTGFSLGALAVNCHHNYVQREQHFGREVLVTRKGAVSAQKGQLGIIPGSMGAKSFIVQGLGNEESFCSCSHGSGRVMSRTKAKIRFTVEDQRRATAHVECRKDKEVIDEIRQLIEINIVIDKLGLEEVGATTNSPVSIDLNGIKLKSILNLMLEPLDLDYTIQDDVLKITSTIRQQGRLITATYPVADLVVPLEIGTPIDGTLSSFGVGTSQDPSRQSTGQLSVGSTSAQFQVGVNPAASLAGSIPGSGMQSEITGGARSINFDSLSSLIPSTIEPGRWAELGG